MSRLSLMLCPSQIGHILEKHIFTMKGCPVLKTRYFSIFHAPILMSLLFTQLHMATLAIFLLFQCARLQHTNDIQDLLSVESFLWNSPTHLGLIYSSVR